MRNKFLITLSVLLTGLYAGGELNTAVALDKVNATLHKMDEVTSKIRRIEQESKEKIAQLKLQIASNTRELARAIMSLSTQEITSNGNALLGQLIILQLTDHAELLLDKMDDQSLDLAKALQNAISTKNTDLINLLINRINPQTLSVDGSIAVLDAAMRPTNLSLLQNLLNKMNEHNITVQWDTHNTLFDMAICHKDTAALTAFVDMMVKQNTLSSQILDNMAYRGVPIELFELILQRFNPPQLNEIDESGNTALDNAKQVHQLNPKRCPAKIIDLLREYGAKTAEEVRAKGK